MLVSTADGRFLWVNEATENLFGYSAVEFMGIGLNPGLSWHTLTVAAADLEADKAMVSALVEGARSDYSLEKSYLSKDGRAIPAKIHVLRWPPDGECVCFLVTVLPLDAQNEMLRDEIVAMRHALADFIASQQEVRDSKAWVMVVSLATWADKNRATAGILLLFIAALLFGDRVLEIWDRINPARP